jgi:predicted AAA+ superfamily ATPase
MREITVTFLRRQWWKSRALPEANDRVENWLECLFLDEIPVAKDWQTWLKHQVDFERRRRIAVTGSATPLATEGQESGMGRWQTIRLATLSFFEYLQIRRLAACGQPGTPGKSWLVGKVRLR